MSGKIDPRLEILPPAQRQLWSALRPAAGLGFVLYGGTAVSLRIGHRYSVDFDFFSERPLDRDAIQAAFPFVKESTVLQDQPNSLGMLVPAPGHGEVKISFFGEIGFGRVGEPDLTADGVMQIASQDDLLATKVKVILQRVEAKDYRDVAALIRAGASLARSLSAAREMFGRSFQPSECMKALVYFEGGDLQTLTQEEKSFLVKTVREVRDLPPTKILSRRLTGQ
jgi:hypothetical protein